MMNSPDDLGLINSFMTPCFILGQSVFRIVNANSIGLPIMLNDDLLSTFSDHELDGLGSSTDGIVRRKSSKGKSKGQKQKPATPSIVLF